MPVTHMIRSFMCVSPEKWEVFEPIESFMCVFDSKEGLCMKKILS